MDKEVSWKSRVSFFSIVPQIAPAIFAMLVIATYQTADGLFIEMFCGDIAIGAVNLFSPVLYLLVAVGIMMGTGGNAVILRLLGKQRPEEASKAFFRTVVTTLALGGIFTAVLLIFRESILVWLGASSGNIDFLRSYYTVLCIFSVSIILQSTISILIMGEGKTTSVTVVTVIGGVTNCVLDFVFMKYFGMGIMGAAVATVIGYFIFVLYGAYYFFVSKKSTYGFKPCLPDFRQIGTICFNGSSDMISNISGGIIALLMNRFMFEFCGEVGISSLSVMQYFQYIIIAVFMGFTMAIEPIFSYHYGTGNTEIRVKAFKVSLLWIIILEVFAGGLMFLFAEPIVAVFFDRGTPFFELTLKGLYFALPASVFVGYNTFASGLFTAFSNGVISALLSVLRSLLILVGCIFVLRNFFGEDGLWASWTVAEAISFVISALFLFAYRKRYKYTTK